MVGNLHFKIDWASLIVGRKFTVFALSYFAFEGNFPSTSPPGDYIWNRGDLTEGFLPYQFGGLIHGGAYFRNFTVFCQTSKKSRFLYAGIYSIIQNAIFFLKWCSCYRSKLNSG